MHRFDHTDLANLGGTLGGAAIYGLNAGVWFVVASMCLGILPSRKYVDVAARHFRVMLSKVRYAVSVKTARS